MDADSWLLFSLLIALILGGGYFAASETAFASVNAMRIRQRAESGEKRALRAKYILDNFNTALSTLLIGNNVMHIGTASIATYLVTKLWGEGYTAYSTIATTVVVFLVSEMVPKQFAKDRPEPTALFFAGSLYWMMKVLAPVARIFDALSGLICRFLKVKPTPTVTEDELVELIDSLAETEPGSQERSQLLHSALEFDDTTAGEIMTPLADVVSVNMTMPQQDVLDIIRENKHTRLPVYQKLPGNLIGVLDTRTYIKSYLASPETTSVRSIAKKAMTTPASKRIDDLFDEMTQSRTHMCMVTDERGKKIGIVTMEDILEELVGEILDEDDDVESVSGKEATV